MTTQEIVSKLWNLCNVLRDDGITYHQYVTELTYILFLKMAKETGTEEQIPEKYRWDELKAKSGVELKKFYKELLSELGDNGTGRIREIYQGGVLRMGLIIHFLILKNWLENVDSVIVLMEMSPAVQ